MLSNQPPSTTIPTKETPLESLKRTVSCTARALSGLEDTEIVFSNQLTPLASHQIRLAIPTTKTANDPALRRAYRGQADLAAVRQAHHNPVLHHKMLPEHGQANALFDALEQARVELVGGQNRKGIAHNIDAFNHHQLESSGQLNQRIASEENLPIALKLMVKQLVGGIAPPLQMQSLLDAWKAQLSPKLMPLLHDLAGLLDDQASYGKQVKDILREMHMNPGDDVADDPQEDDQEQGDDEEIQDNQTRSESDEDEQQNQPSEQQQGALDQGADGDESQEIDDELAQQMEQMHEVEDAGGEASETRPEHDLSNATKEKFYHAFTKEFDEILLPEDLCNPEELAGLRQMLDQHLAQLQGVVSKLANRLQRKLLAQQQRGWEFDLEEGHLDSARLSRIIIDPTSSLSFKAEKETDFRDTILTLLIDNSGSMRGRPITIASVCADILAQTMERCGVKIEILGFTTSAWKGGQSREKWIAQEKPNMPGRLNDLRHIIYKQADSPYRRSRRNLGLMLREGLLKENIDGEALLWAHGRLLARKEERRILMVISDGAPVDDSTLSVNSGNYLERHLRDVIDDIESKSEIELVAIGIGHDVTRYYKRALTIVDVNQLGGAITKQLADLFDL
ncbi:MAG: cobaltochelatase subunit CobT [Alphaproteobacteria bacterium]